MLYVALSHQNSEQEFDKSVKLKKQKQSKRKTKKAKNK